jgi:hypothetical protein
VNSKRVYRIYVEEKLIVRRRKRRRRICAQARVLFAAPAKKNEAWTMDFLLDALATGRKVRTLSIEDAYTREMLAIEVDTSLPALRVVRVLEKLRLERGLDRDRPRHGIYFQDAGPVGLREQGHAALHHTWTARWKTATSKASMASSARNAATNTGFSR